MKSKIVVKGPSSKAYKMGLRHQKIAADHEEGGRQKMAEKHRQIAIKHFSKVNPKFFLRAKFGNKMFPSYKVKKKRS
jgi:hypothetical protein